MQTFNSVDDVQTWARSHGGIEGVREALASGTFGSSSQSIRMALLFVEREELKIAGRSQNKDKARLAPGLSTAERIADAIEKSAREAYICRWLASTAIVVAVFALILAVLR